MLGCPVHPRACGEQLRLRLWYRNVLGSSPRLRGTADKHNYDVSPVRFIPAPAGNSRACPETTPGAPVHPRACGEQKALAERSLHEFGSSPRLRGTEITVKDWMPAIRFIPAPAGNSQSSACGIAPRSVHPRACGEQSLSGISSRLISGSSPRLRGTATSWTRISSPCRFIPAPAGNSSTAPGDRNGLLNRFIPAPAGNSSSSGQTIHSMVASVHPRACGEQALFQRWEHLQSRFIPAPAGNRPDRRSSRVPVHPRACGEQVTSLARYCSVSSGSSPRLRGTVACSPPSLKRVPGSSPRLRGTDRPHSSRRRSSSTTVHPRACGEQCI